MTAGAHSARYLRLVIFLLIPAAFFNGYDGELRKFGEGPVLDVAYDLEDSRELEPLLALEVDQALAAVWPRLRSLLAT